MSKFITGSYMRDLLYLSSKSSDRHINAEISQIYDDLDLPYLALQVVHCGQKVPKAKCQTLASLKYFIWGSRERTSSSLLNLHSMIRLYTSPFFLMCGYGKL